MSLAENIKICSADFDRIEEMLELLKQEMPEANISFVELKESMLEGDYVLAAMTPNDDMVGLVWYCPWDSGTTGVHALVVDAEHRNKGVGSKLLKEVDPCSIIPKTYITIDADNFSALRWLNKRGYSVTKEVSFGGKPAYILLSEFKEVKKLSLSRRLRWRMT